MVTERRKSALRRAAERVAREASLLGERASATVSGIKPAVSPWLGRATSRVALLSVQVDPAALRSALEEYLVRAVHTVSVPESWRRSEPRAAGPTPGPGVLHLSRTVELHLGQLQKFHNFARAHDPVEAVHQLRVTSRRLRTFVEMFAPFADPALVRRVRAPLRQVTRAVRDLRDADVQVQGLEERLKKASSEPERVAVNHLIDRVRRRRRSYVERAEKRLRKLELGELATSLRGMLDQVAHRAEAPSASYRLVAEIAYQPIVDEARALAPRDSGVPTPEALHEFRLALKQLRYAAELIEPALNGRFVTVHEHAKRLQSMLGEHQDWVEFEKLVSKRHGKAVREGRETLALGLEGILKEAKHQRELCRSHCLEECARLPGSALFSGLSDTPKALSPPSS
ncbi:MAG TPA: CHAD domain-containing protein [Polyangiaceae bacterium]|nr:CHAD domain-containing protein [Polyangiaceae bacterium]